MLTLALILGLAVAVTGALTLGYARKRQEARRLWLPELEAAARLLPAGARTALGEAPELRADIDGRTVTVRIVGDGAAGQARAFVALNAEAPATRLWLGWDAQEPPADWRPVSEVTVDAHRLDGTVLALSDDASLAQRALDGAYLDLLDVRREAEAHAAILSVRGGYLELQLDGTKVSAHLLNRLARATARLAADLPYWASGG